MSLHRRLSFQHLEPRQLLSVSVDSPANHVVLLGGPWDGVLLNRNPENNNTAGSVLLPTGRHLLTAAHTRTTEGGTPRVIEYQLPGGNLQTATVVAYYTHNFTAQGEPGDIAILELASPLPEAIPRYDIYRGADEIGKVGIRVGFGASGQGDIQPGLLGIKRIGTNRYELLRNSYQLQYDFDNGTPGANTLGDLGEGADEVLAGGGDSGSPVFIDGRIAGITVFGLLSRLGYPAFGIQGYDERVSSHASWIDSVIDIIGPRVTNVTISSSTGVHTPYSFNTAVYNGQAVIGSGNQIRTVPVGGADTLDISFNEAVDVAFDDLAVVGLRTGWQLHTNANQFTYDTVAKTARWTFLPFDGHAAWPADDNYVIKLSDSVTDVTGNALDGEWINPVSIITASGGVSEFPSGNGQSGGSFQFVVTLLFGDRTQNNVVALNSDLLPAYNNIGAGSGMTWSDGDFNGNGTVSFNSDVDPAMANVGKPAISVVFIAADRDGDFDVDADDSEHDFNGDGVFDGADLLLWQRQFGISLVVDA